MTDYTLELKIFEPGKEYRPELNVKLSKQSRRAIADTMIALGILLKDHDLPERDAKGKFLKKEKTA